MERSGTVGSAGTADVPRETLLRIADDLPLGVALLVGPDLVHRYLNRAYQRLAPDKAMLGLPYASVWPEISGETLPMLRSVLDSNEPTLWTDRRYKLRRSHEGPLTEGFFSFRFCPFDFQGEKSVLLEVAETTTEVATRNAAASLYSVAEHTAGALSDVFESMADGFIALDNEWRFTYVNGRAEYLLHRKRSELIGQNIWEVLPDVVDSVFYHQFQKAMNDRESVSFEEYYAPNDMWASVHAIPSANGLTIYISNITSQKQAEAALAKSEGQLRAVIDNSPAVIYMKDVEGRFIRVNDEFVDRFGMTKEDAVGKDDYDLLPKNIADEMRANDRQVLESGQARQFEEEVLLSDGKSIVYLSTKFPLKDASGRIYGTAGISTDVNERIRQARALAESEQRFRKIFEEGPLGVVLLDKKLSFQLVNERYAEMLGYTKDELIGMTIDEVTFEPDRERSVQLPRQLLAETIPYYRLEKRYVRKDGSPLWASVHGSLIRNDAGAPMFILALAEDITQRKLAENAVRDRDRAIRSAYSDVIAAVTGGKLVLMTPDEIEDSLGDPGGAEWIVSEFAELSGVRRELTKQLLLVGMDSERADSYVLAACEGFTNAIKHGGGGSVSVRHKRDTVQIVISDTGPGIDFEHLPKATLVPGFSTASSLGMGFTIMLEVCDRVLLSTQPGLTVLVLEATGVQAPAHVMQGVAGHSS